MSKEKFEVTNHILPFLWLKGEERETLREYMKVIHDAHIGAVCVESRPHPDFVGPRWWQELDVILGEAQKYGMKVWILDDSHFPTGYANGAMERVNPNLRRCSIVYCRHRVSGFGCCISVDKFLRKKGNAKNIKGEVLPDMLISATAFRVDRYQNPIDLTDRIEKGKLKWKVPQGEWRIGLVKKSFTYGTHPNYINMMDPDSCRVLIDTVYEAHYRHYGELFGNTIAGFFSDEPELGNGRYLKNIQLGMNVDQPWSDCLISDLEVRLGPDWKNRLHYIWENDLDEKETAMVRHGYMDVVTRNVEKAFSMQIGDWCWAHGVSYIGHVIEDNNQHGRPGAALGHYFRGLKGQDMSGIDDIGVQVYPQGEDGPDKYFHILPRDGEFFHYMLAKLAQSQAAIDPRKHGNAMCEIFGNYGWSEGFRLETFLADHFMVRGINYFVPHAYNMAPFPDGDCPPHFYAHGNNPQHRHFYALMDYMNRVSSLISDGHHAASVALLYHAEMEWCGQAMLDQKPARVMADCQIDFDVVPADVFTETEYYQTNLQHGFQVGTQNYTAFVVPYAKFIPLNVANAIPMLHKNGVRVIFIDGLPTGISDGADGDLEKLKDCVVCSLAQLPEMLNHEAKYRILPENNRIRVLHYIGRRELYYLVNEGTDIYRGTLQIPGKATGFWYDAWTDASEKAEISLTEGMMGVSVTVRPLKSRILVLGDSKGQNRWLVPEEEFNEVIPWTRKWKRSICRSIEYPKFRDEKEVTLPDDVSRELPKFSGVIHYENTFEIRHSGEMILTISDAYEGVEARLNGRSLGVQVVPPYRFDLADPNMGENIIELEVTTTLERERRGSRESILELLQRQKIMQPTGITGEVKIVRRTINHE